MKIQGTIELKADQPQVRLSNVSHITITKDPHELAFGVAGDYGGLEVQLSSQEKRATMEAHNFSITPSIDTNPHFPWIGALFSLTAPLPTDFTSDSIGGVVLKADEVGTVMCARYRYEGVTPIPGGYGDIAAIRLKPWPSDINGDAVNSVTMTGSEGRQIFTFDPFRGVMPKALTSKLMALAAGSIWNPYNNTDVSVHLGFHSCG